MSIPTTDKIELAAKEYERYNSSESEITQAESSGRYHGFIEGIKWYQSQTQKKISNKTKIVSFELTMPNKGSWNGKWSSENDAHFIIKKFKTKELEFNEHFKSLLKDGSDYWYYNFGDGWGAGVTAKIVDAPTAKKMSKVTRGFCGYDWMVNSIIKNGTIKL